METLGELKSNHLGETLDRKWGSERQVAGQTH